VWEAEMFESIRRVVAVLPSFAGVAGLGLAVWGCGGGPGVGGEASDPPIAAVASRGESLFNGRDLTGWNGDPEYWRVENGAIVGETTPEKPLRQNTFIIWEGGEVGDFMLSLDFRVNGGNSGVQYRSKVVEGWSLSGYQADIDAENRYTGMLYEERGRGIIARRGQRVVIRPDGRFDVVGLVGDTAELRSVIKPGDWNHYEITAVGNRLVHRINGRVMVEVTDEQAEARASSGRLGLQIHTGPPMKVEFKNIVLVRLSSGSTVP
jgi:hypothetical protein